MNYDWSTNPIKLARARGNLGENATEEELKTEYTRLGGYIAGEPNLVIVPEPIITVSESDTSMPVVEEVKKKAKKVVTKAKKVVKKKK